MQAARAAFRNPFSRKRDRQKTAVAHREPQAPCKPEILPAPRPGRNLSGQGLNLAVVPQFEIQLAVYKYNPRKTSPSRKSTTTLFQNVLGSSARETIPWYFTKVLPVSTEIGATAIKTTPRTRDTWCRAIRYPCQYEPLSMSKFSSCRVHAS